MSTMRSSPKGASLVEFSLILTILIVITFGIIEFGMLIYNQQVITNASREGARAGVVASIPRVPDTGGTYSIDSVVQAYCANHLITFGDQNTPRTTVGGYRNNAAFGDELEVRVNYQYSFLVIPSFVPGIDTLFNMQAVTVMRYE
jgi:Flp pilus assembly protein TadG